MTWLSGGRRLDPRSVGLRDVSYGSSKGMAIASPADLQRCSLRRGEKQIELRPKAFDVLRYFVENWGRVIGKEELMRAVWPNVFVTDDALVQCVTGCCCHGSAERRGDCPRCLRCFRCKRGAQSWGVAATLARSQLFDTSHIGQPSLL
jgi:hypothetical protein